MNQRFLGYLSTIILCLSGLFYFSNIDLIWGNSPAAAENKSESTATTELPTRQELEQNFQKQRSALLIYGASDPHFAGQYQAFADSFKARSRWIKFRIQSDLETRDDDLRGTTIFLVGTTKSNRIIEQLTAKLPLHAEQQQFYFKKNKYDNPKDVLSLFYPNPLDHQYGLRMICGNNDAYLLSTLVKSPDMVLWAPGDFRVYRESQTQLMGFFSQKDGARWQFDEENYRDFASETHLAAKTAHYRFFLHNMQLSAEEIETITSRQEHSFQLLEDFLDVKAPFSLIDYHIYPTFEDKGLTTGSTSLSHFDQQRPAIYSVIHDKIRGDDFVKDAEMVLESTLGKPSRQALETGLSVYFSNNWRGMDYEYWAARLYASENDVSLQDLLNDALFNNESSLVMAPLAGSFVAFVIDKWGKQPLLENYHNWQPVPGEIEMLENGWKAYLKNLAEKYRQKIAADRAAFPHIDDFQKGFCHAHEGYRIYNGYLSKKSDDALKKLQTLGTNAVSITPFSFMRDPNRPVFLRHMRSSGSENDESVIHAALSAESLGMAVMLKPHLWLGGGSWPGDIAMKNDADWALFFDYYYRWMRHFALLAEMYHMDMLSVGVELAKATVTHEQQWRTMIRKLRKLYSGKMTYAANWGAEFENIKFWDELDFIGLNCYYPLSSNENADDEALKAGVAKIAVKVENVYQKFRKPVIFTEIGYTSTPASWKNPHKTSGGKPVDLEAQARCYRAVFDGLYGKKWLAGIYWWKWPSFLEYGGVRDNDFTPNNKPAQQIIAEWYSKPW